MGLKWIYDHCFVLMQLKTYGPIGYLSEHSGDLWSNLLTVVEFQSPSPAEGVGFYHQ